jgi:hypothetical protein
MGPNRVDVSIPSPEVEKRPGFRNIVFSCYLEFQAMEIARKPSDSESNTPLLKAFRF